MNARIQQHTIITTKFTAALLVALTVVACRSPERELLLPPTAPSSTVPVGSDFTLAPGESVVLGNQGPTLTFTGVVNESRCPTHATIQCVWAGSAVIGVRINDGGTSRVITLETIAPRNFTVVGRYHVQLLDVTPAPVTLDSIPPASYRAILRISEP